MSLYLKKLQIAVFTLVLVSLSEAAGPGGRFFDIDGVSFVLVSGLSEELGGAMHTRLMPVRAEGRIGASQVLFTPGNCFFRRGNRIEHMAFPARWTERGIAISRCDARRFFGEGHADAASEPDPGTLIENKPGHAGISRISCSAAHDTTWIKIEGVAPGRVQCTYLYPALAIDCENRNFDKDLSMSARGCGFIDSIFAIPYRVSAQVNCKLSVEIDSPAVRYSADSTSVQIALTPRKSAPPVDEEEFYLKSSELTVRTVVIDPGHGGRDPGAIGPSGTREKDVVLACALELRDTLQSISDLTVYLTRETDVFIPLHERTRFANEKKADLFISLHANSIGGGARKRRLVRGYKVYFLSQARNEDDRLVAMKENSVIELEEKSREYYNDLQNILIEMAGNEYLRESQEFSIQLSEAFEHSLEPIRKLHLGVGQAGFYVLKGAYMPSVLIEIGFISNPHEEKIIVKPPFRASLARAVAGAIVGFKKRIEGISER